MLIWLITFLLLRNYTGGYHATSHFKCIFFSIIYGIISLCSIDILVNLNPLFKFIIWDVIFIIHIIFEPIISCKQNQTTSYKKHTKVKIYTILIIAGLLIVTLSYFHPSIGTAIFTGIISAEILYLVEKYIILCPTKSYNG